MEWRRLRRETGLIEHLCEHGVGHPILVHWLSTAGELPV